MSDEFMPYPEHDGEPDHHAAAEQLGFREATPMSPVFISDGAETHAVVGVDEESGEVKLMDAHFVGNQGVARYIDQEDLWDDWVNGDLLYKQRKFVNVEDEVYNSERKAAVDRRLLQDALDVAESELDDMRGVDPELEGMWSIKVRGTVEALRGVLGDD